MSKPSSKNAKGGGTIRQRSDGRWEARYTVGRDPGTGKQIQRSVYGQTQAEVRKKLSRISTEIDDGIYKDPSKITVGEWLDIWLSEYMGSVKPNTVATYITKVNNHLKPAFGAVRLTALSAPAIQKLCNDMQKGEKGGRKYSPKSIKDLHGVLHKALQQAVEIGYLRFNPSDNCKLPRVKRRDIRPFENDEMSAFLQRIQGDKYELLYIVALFTGIRKSELIGLTWDCVDFMRGSITIKQQLQLSPDGFYYFTTPKNDKSRTISVAPTVIDALKKQMRKQIEERTAADALWQQGEFQNIVFTNEFGGHMKPKTLHKRFKAIVTEMGLPDMRFHDLRHTYAVMSIQAGDDIKTVKENMGHYSAAFTLDVYGHVTEQMRKDSASRMEQFIQRVIS